MAYHHEWLLVSDEADTYLAYVCGFYASRLF